MAGMEKQPVQLCAGSVQVKFLFVGIMQVEGRNGKLRIYSWPRPLVMRRLSLRQVFFNYCYVLDTAILSKTPKLLLLFFLMISG